MRGARSRERGSRDEGGRRTAKEPDQTQDLVTAPVPAPCSALRSLPPLPHRRGAGAGAGGRAACRAEALRLCRGRGRAARATATSPKSAGTPACPGKSTAAAGTPSARVGRNGKPCRWDGRILADVIDRIQEQSELFSETDWNSRSVVEIRAAKKSDGWFFHAITGEEWLLEDEVPHGPQHVLTATSWCGGWTSSR